MEEETVKFFFTAVLALPAFAGEIFLIYNLIGWQAVTGVFLLCILMPYFAVLSYANAKLRLRTATVSDQRISLMNQVVSGIRAVKMHAWEEEYGRKIKHVRRYGKLSFIFRSRLQRLALFIPVIVDPNYSNLGNR